MAKRYFAKRKKVVGILTELKAEADQVHAVIIGPGINVNQTANDFPEELKDVATSLQMELGEKVDRAALIQTIMSTFEKRYDEYMTYGFAPIKQLWESYAMTIESVSSHAPSMDNMLERRLGLMMKGPLTRNGGRNPKHLLR